VEPLGFDPPALLLGPGAGVSEDTSFQDVAVSPDGATVATFGSTLSGEYAGSLRPRVHRGVPNAREAAAGAVETEEFDLGSTHSRRELPIDECHHPAWRPDGARVLCTNYGDYEVFGDLRVRPLYQFSRHRFTFPGTWRQADDGTGSGLLFEPPDRDALGDSFSFDGSFGGIFPSCARVTYKFGQWCGSDNYVVVTASCTDGPDSSGDQPPILYSRILLVRLEPFAFWDLTSWVEDREGLRRGALAGIFPTCSPVPDTLVWGGPE
jgi:hypothetical protein